MPFKPMAGLAVKRMPPSGDTHPGRVKECCLEQHLSRLARDLCLGAPITPASATARPDSVTTRSSCASLRVTPSRVARVSPGSAERTPIWTQRAAAEQGVVKRMKRLPISEEDIVGDVDDVGDGAHPGSLKPLLEP